MFFGFFYLITPQKYLYVKTNSIRIVIFHGLFSAA